MKKKLSLVLMIIVMLTIFYFSSQDSSVSHSLSIPVSLELTKILNNLGFHIIINDDVMRKIAHVTLYSFLGMISLLTFHYITPIEKRCGRYSFLFCFIFSSLDEIHQLFSLGRGATYTDVILDSIAAMIGILIIKLFIHIHQSYLARKTIENNQ